MKYIEKYLKDIIKVKPLGTLTTKEDELDGISGEMVYIGGKCSNIFISRIDYANWLEKQVPIDEEKVLIGARKDIALSIMDFLNRNTLGMCLSNTERADLEDAVMDSDWSKVYNYMKKKAAKEKKIDDANKVEPKDYSSIDPHFSKPGDKVEPKFKVGYWVVNNTTLNSCHILKVEHGQYICDDCSFPIAKENEYHPWTIKDAKNGDILTVIMCPEGTWIGIFKEQNDRTFSSHCFVNTEGIFKNGSYNHGNGTAIHPATKKQRDFLFQKMKEAKYEWDAEKKELKKIKNKLKKIESQHSLWSISDFRTWQHIVSDVLTKHDGIGQYLDNGFCKKIAQYMQEEWSNKLSL